MFFKEVSAKKCQITLVLYSLGFEVNKDTSCVRCIWEILKRIYIYKFYKLKARLKPDFGKLISSNIPLDAIRKESCGSILNVGSNLRAKNYVLINLWG